MSEQNHDEGMRCYANGHCETRAWFEKQWLIWPKRADEANTTNLSFLHGGVDAYRAEYNTDPRMSPDFTGHVEWLDRHALALSKGSDV